MNKQESAQNDEEKGKQISEIVKLYVRWRSRRELINIVLAVLEYHHVLLGQRGQCSYHFVVKNPDDSLFKGVAYSVEDPEQIRITNCDAHAIRIG